MNLCPGASRPFALLSFLVLCCIPAGAGELPEWWPSEVPVIESATIIEVDHAEDKGLPSVDFKIPAGDHSMESVIDFYRARLEAEGWSVGSARDTGMARSVTATKRSIDRRVIVTAKKPGTILNRDPQAIRLEVIVYRSVPGR